MRNRIYREVLVCPGRIRINDRHYQQPALLKCCWQIRAEACSIYYGENYFVLQVKGFQSNAMASWCQHSRYYRDLYKERICCSLSVLPGRAMGKSSDLLKWLRRYHHRDVPMYRSIDKDLATKKLVHRLFRTVRLLMGVDWKIVEEVLENQMMVFEENTTSGYFFTDRQKVQES